ncbi:hypothetical protein Pla175_43480 [Pirellulimonas nuda]|uniref:Autotransporter-associated beta strand repeat protein n=1 Tax=Pirellulimonas nuda TaxID=2528009 RepID=A0A518DHJ3_9BACT|nr:LamG domain-containing protein [Pirellulimonas nuda]QDU90934.1 hypothetical protein Pla175_43480 [Pirellulimonas nuda]
MFRNTLIWTAATALAATLGSEALAQDITTGLLGHWKLDEGGGATVAADSVGANPGAVQGAVTTGLSGRVDNGYVFAGTNANRVLTTATAPLLGIDTGPMSMFGFVKTADIGTIQQHIFSGNNGAAGRWNLGIIDNSMGSTIPGEPPGGDGVGELFWFHNGGLGFVHTDLVLSDNTFHLVGISRSATNDWTAYVDNTTFALGNSAGALGGSAISFGERPNAGQFPLEGTLDDMRIYNRVLSAADIAALLAQPSPPPTPNQWTANASGSWLGAGNWLNAVPNGTADIARFGAIPSAANITVVVDSAVTAKGVAFNSATTSYIVAGTQTLTLDSDTGSISLGVEQAGSHEFQAAVSVNDGVTANIAAGGRLDFNNALRLNGQTLTKSGDGTLNINNQLGSLTGTVNVTAGALGGTGKLGGALNNQAGGTVAPGASAGKLSVSGAYTQAAGATLAIELGGTAAGLFDQLAVAGTAGLSGVVDISLINGFTPANGDSFEIVSAASTLTMTGLTLAGDSSGFSLVKTGNSLFLNFAGGGGVAGDFNADGFVDAADYTAWRDRLGSNTPLPNDNGLGVPIGAQHYTLWKGSFGNPGVGALAAGSSPVPEPSAALLLAAVAGVSILVTRRGGVR